jgi:hypothetical protein
MSRWRRGSALVSWSLKLTLPDPTPSIGDALRSVMAILGGFGEARDLRLVTASQGDTSPALRLTGQPAQLDALLSAADIEEVWLGLDLYMWTGLSDTETVENGATICLEHGPEGELLCTLFLNVDFHAAQTWGDERDNRELHRWNGPQLEAFLRRLELRCGAQLQSMDAGDYAGWVTSRGFQSKLAS